MQGRYFRVCDWIWYLNLNIIAYNYREPSFWTYVMRAIFCSLCFSRVYWNWICAEFRASLIPRYGRDEHTSNFQMSHAILNGAAFGFDGGLVVPSIISEESSHLGTENFRCTIRRIVFGKRWPLRTGLQPRPAINGDEHSMQDKLTNYKSHASC